MLHRQKDSHSSPGLKPWGILLSSLKKFIEGQEEKANREKWYKINILQGGPDAYLKILDIIDAVMTKVEAVLGEVEGFLD